MTREELLHFMAWWDNEYARDKRLRFHRERDADKYLAKYPLPPAEGAEEILTSLIKSLGEPTKTHNHIYEIRPYTVEGKTEWWMFHNGVGSGEPLAQWLNKFATLHAQKMTQENLREELIAYDKYASRWIDNYRAETAEDCVDEYLKSKEQ